MTAFLNNHRLRREALPGTLHDILRLTGPRRTALTAIWRVEPDGRLTCRWDTQSPETSRPPH